MIDTEKIKLNRKERKLLKQIERYGISKFDNRINSKEFYTLNAYKMLTEYIDAKFPECPRDEYGNKTFNAYKTVPETSRYWLYQKSHFWHEFRAWATIIIAVLGLALSIYNTFAISGQSELFHKYISQTEQQSSPIQQ